MLHQGGVQKWYGCLLQWVGCTAVRIAPGCSNCLDVFCPSQLALEVIRKGCETIIPFGPRIQATLHPGSRKRFVRPSRMRMSSSSTSSTFSAADMDDPSQS